MEWCDLQLSDGFQFSDCSGNESWPYLHSSNDANSHSTTISGNVPFGKDGPLKGGFLHNGCSWAWLCRAGTGGLGATLLQIVCLRNGKIFVNYDFKEVLPSHQNYYIGFVEELSASDHSTQFANAGAIVMDGLRNSLLAVILQTNVKFNDMEDSGQSSDVEYENDFLCLYSIRLNAVVSIIQLPWTVNCLRPLKPIITSCHSLLKNFDGCLAIGTDNGYLSFLDLCLNRLQNIENQTSNRLSTTKCVVVDHELQSCDDIIERFYYAQHEDLCFVLQIDVGDQLCGIQCLLPIYPAMTLSVGLQDGRLVCFDLSNLQVFYIATPPARIGPCSLVKMDYLEPLDDPRVSFYICSMHHNGEVLYAFLYSFMFKNRSMPSENRADAFLSCRGNFQTAMLCLQMPLEANRCIPLRCQAVCRSSPQNEDESYCLCALSWYSLLGKRNKLLLFDLNQWYKDQMPYMVDPSKPLNYLAGYICMEGNGMPSSTPMNTLPFGGILDSWLNTESIATFHSVLRLEEHFYPNSLSFDFTLLHLNGNNIYNWEGAQNKIINIMRNSDANIFLDVDPYINELIHSRLIPMFMDDVDWNDIESISQSCKYEILMATALEQNCMNLLQDCAKSWMDGSFMGRPPYNLSLSLSVLTDWIIKQATFIKRRCNKLCKGLFVVDGHSLDQREQNEFAFITHQLKLLSNLLEYILYIAQKYIPEQVFSNLKSLEINLKMAKNYQEVILWLTNIGLLPQGHFQCSSYVRQSKTSIVRREISSDQKVMLSYPYTKMKDFYDCKRASFHKINHSFIDKKTGSCRLLYIDAFLQHVCSDSGLSAQWEECGETCLYPPISLEAMLRVFLLPKLDFEQQCSLLWYFFLDLNLFLNNDEYRDVFDNVLRFPSVFKLPASVAKTVQSAWNLDHDYLMLSVDDFMSPLNKNNNYPQWLVEILIQVLLIQNEANLALRIMASQSNLVTPILKLYTMLDNGLLAEAFHFVRSTDDVDLLQVYFICCLQRGEFGVIRDLALNETEGNVLQDILKENKLPGSQSLHFVYLLQRFKYLEAVSYMDELAKSKRITGCSSSITIGNNTMNSPSNVMERLSQMDTPNMMLSAYNLTMTPITQGLTDVYLKIRNKIKQKEINQTNPVPLSCQLIKQNANDLLGGIYHSSALSAHFATYYRGEINEKLGDGNHADRNRLQNVQQVMNCNNAPFLRRPQTFGSIWDRKQNISYPTVYTVTEKRSHPDRDNGPGRLRDEWNYPGLDSPSLPNKRRRLIPENSEEIKEILRDLASATTSEVRKDNKDNESTLPYANIEFLRQPVVGAKPNISSSDDIEMQVESMNIDLPGILKANYDSRTEITNHDERRKSIRFTLPEKKLSKNEILMEPNELDVKDSQFASSNRPVLTKKALQMFNEADKHSQSQEKTTNTIQDSSSSEDNSQSSKIVCSNFSENEFPLSPSIKNISLSSKNGSPRQRLTLAESRKLSTTSFPMPRKPLYDITEVSNEYISERKSTENEVTIEASSNKISSILSVKSEICEETLLNRKENENENGSDKSVTCPIAVALTLPMDEDLSEEVALATVACSSVTEFAPPISSSRVGVNIQSHRNQGDVKMSECSTVVGTWTNIIDVADTVSGVPEDLFAMPSKALVSLPSNYEDQPILEEKQRQHMLQTTLSMSTLDVDVSTPLAQSPSVEQVAGTSSSTSILNRDQVRSELNPSVTSVNVENRINSLREETVSEIGNDYITLSSSTTNITPSYSSNNSERSDQIFATNIVDTDGDADDEAEELLVIDEEEREEEEIVIDDKTLFTNIEEQDKTAENVAHDDVEDGDNSSDINAVYDLVKISSDEDDTSNFTYENSGSNVDDRVSAVNYGSEVHSLDDYTLGTPLSEITDNSSRNSANQKSIDTQGRSGSSQVIVTDIIEIIDNSLNDSNDYIDGNSNTSGTFNVEAKDEDKNVLSSTNRSRDVFSENDFRDEKDDIDIKKSAEEIPTCTMDSIEQSQNINVSSSTKNKNICNMIETIPLSTETEEEDKITLELESNKNLDNFNDNSEQSASRTSSISITNVDTEHNISETNKSISERRTSIIMSVDIKDGVNEIENRTTKAVNKDLVSEIGLFLTESSIHNVKYSEEVYEKPEENILNRLNYRGNSEPPIELSPYSLRHKRSTSVPAEKALNNRPEQMEIQVNDGVKSNNKISRHRSISLDVKAESSPIFDSPSSRTRSRLRLNSVDKEVDLSLSTKNNTPDVLKRKRTSSSNAETKIQRKEKSKSVEPLEVTPKRATRRNSVGSVSEARSTTLRRTKNLQIPELIEEEQEREQEGNESPEEEKPTSLVDQNLSKQSNSIQEDKVEETYATSRRLTRNQMMIMKKSEGLLKSKSRNDSESSVVSTSKKGLKSKIDPLRTDMNDDSVGQSPAVRTRKSLTTTSSARKKSKKELNRVDEDITDFDDAASVASSLESCSSTRSRSQRETKSKTRTNRNLTQSSVDSPSVSTSESRKPGTRSRKQ